jgi:hypothetical protein
MILMILAWRAESQAASEGEAHRGHLLEQLLLPQWPTNANR